MKGIYHPQKDNYTCRCSPIPTILKETGSFRENLKNSLFIAWNKRNSATSK